MKYKNILIIMGNFKADKKNQGLGYDKLDTFYNLLNLTNLIQSESCLIKNYKSTIEWSQ